MITSPRIGIAMGDPAGISPELLAKLIARADLMATAAVAVIGDRRVLAAGEAAAKLAVEMAVVGPGEVHRAAPGVPVFVDLGHLDPREIAVGEASAAGGAFAMRNFREALGLAKAGRLDGVMFTPFNKLALKKAGNPYPDEIRWAADVLGWTGGASEYNKLDHLWNARVTSHEPLRAVADMLTRERILAAIAATEATLEGAGVARPRIAVAGLNPHAGEGGVFGREEIDTIAPAVAAARARGIEASGPFPPDTVFMRARGLRDFDVVVAMYHDQGLIPVKYLGIDDGVNVTLGLPFVRTSPDHGTAFDIAGRPGPDGRGLASAHSLLAAIREADALSAAAPRGL